MKPLIKHDRECSILVFGEVQILVYMSLVCMSHKMAEKLRIITICVVTASRCVGLNHCSIHSLWCLNTVDIRLCLSINVTKFYQSRIHHPTGATGREPGIDTGKILQATLPVSSVYTFNIPSAQNT